MWDWLVNLVYIILNFIQGFVVDWGLAIIILTLIMRIVLTPLTVKSLKSSAKMQVLQPKLMEIQERYANDPRRQQEELSKFYNENKFNPLGGCLPMLLQMPIFFALFGVLRDHVPAGSSFYGIIPDLSLTPGGTFATGDPSIWLPYVISVVLFGVLTFIPSYLQAKNSTGAQASSMKSMAIVMGLMMVFIGWGIPAGVLLYYNTSAIWGVIQQVFITRNVMEKATREHEAKLGAAPIQVDVVRQERKPRPHKKK